MLYKILILSFGIVNFSYSMNKTEEGMFAENFAKLSPAIAKFVIDFVAWPEQQQKKVVLSSNSGGFSITINKEPAASHKYGGNIAEWFNSHLTETDRIPFFLVMNYVKNESGLKR